MGEIIQTDQLAQSIVVVNALITESLSRTETRKRVNDQVIHKFAAALEHSILAANTGSLLVRDALNLLSNLRSGAETDLSNFMTRTGMKLDFAEQGYRNADRALESFRNVRTALAQVSNAGLHPESDLEALSYSVNLHCAWWDKQKLDCFTVYHNSSETNLRNEHRRRILEVQWEHISRQYDDYSTKTKIVRK